MPHSAPMWAPFSATERFISSTTGTSTSVTAADSQKTSRNPPRRHARASSVQGRGYFASWFNVLISTRAVGPDEAGF
jgi:hypothetical protein